VSSTDEKVESGDYADGDGPSDEAGGEEQEAEGVPSERRRTAGHDAHVPRAGRRLRVRLSDDGEGGGGGGGFIPDDGGFDGGGGFIPNDDDQESGGFVVEDKTPDLDEGFTVRKSQHTRTLEGEEQPLIATTTTTTTGSASAQREGSLRPSTGTASQNGEARLIAMDDTSVGEAELVRHGEDVLDRAVHGVRRRREEAFELHGTTMTDAELEEARTLQELYESGAMEDAAGVLPRERRPPEQTLGDGGQEEHVGSTEEEGEGAGLIIEAESDRGATVPNEVYDDAEARVAADPSSSEEDDKGSLMSEDPDDEDAEPEWLP
ncbi:MAG: hypothetical protein Q9173_004591, partial [Seirophora scorigena]